MEGRRVRAFHRRNRTYWIGKRNFSARSANRSFNRSWHNHNMKKTCTKGSRFRALTAIGNLVNERTWRSIRKRSIKKHSRNIHFRGTAFVGVSYESERNCKTTNRRRQKMSQTITRDVGRFYSRKGFLNPGEQVLYAFKNKSWAVPRSIALTNERIIVHGGFLRNPAKRNLSFSEKGFGISRDIYSFTYSQVQGTNVRNNYFSADLEITYGGAFIVLDGMRKHEAQTIINLINRMKSESIRPTGPQPSPSPPVLSAPGETGERQKGVFCHSCGKKSTLESKFCNICGTALILGEPVGAREPDGRLCPSCL